MEEKKVALYCRVAHADQTAMELQSARLQRFAEIKGLAPCVSYLDNGYSGLSDDRPAFQWMNADIKKGEIGTVVMADISRISRQYGSVFSWLDYAEQHEVSVLFANDDSTMESLAEIRKTALSLQESFNKKEGA